MSTELRKKAKNDFEKDFFKLMNASVFGKTMGNTRNHRDTKLTETEARRNFFVSEPTNHTKLFSKKELAIEINKIQMLMIKPVC